MSEVERLQALDDYGILDTAPEEAFDRLTSLAADLFDVPIALISLVDAERQWFKSRHGLEAQSTPRSQAFCAHALDLEAGATLVVEDATRDQRFRTNPLVTGEPLIRFYAGALLTGADGFNFGTLCVIDTKVRPAPSPKDLLRLKTLAGMVVDELELRRTKRLAHEKQQLLTMAERMSGVGHWRYRLSDGRVLWSDEVYRIHGVTRETFDPNLGSTVGFYHEDDRAKIEAHIADAVSTGRGYEFELRIRRADGEVRNVTAKAECILGEKGEVSVLCGVFRDVTDQKQVLKNLERGQARYKLLADNVADVITRIRLDGSSSYISPAIHALLGYTPKEMTGRPAHAFVYGPDQARILAVFGEMAKGVEERSIQHRAAHKDGRAIWVETHFKLIRDQTGAPLEMVAVIRNVSERKALEDGVAQARDAAEDLVRRAEIAETAAGLGNWRLDARTRDITWSAQMYRIYGFAPDAALDLAPLMAMTHPEDAAAASARLEQQLRTGAADENSITRIVRSNGEVRYLAGNSRVERSPDGEILAVIGTIIDVTDQKTVEFAMAASEERFRLMAQNAPDMISESKLDGTLTYVSPACRTITGFSPEELVGGSFFSVMHPEDGPKVLEMCQAVFASKGKVTPWPVEFRARHKAGHEIWLECKPTLAVDANGRFTGLNDIVRDITTRKTLEAQLRLAQSDAEDAAAVKGEFLANMSHELRTPLTSIIGFTGLAAGQADLSDLTRTYVERVGDASRALLCTVNDILDFSKLEAGQVSIQPEPVSLAKLCRATLDLFTPQAGAKDLSLTLEGDVTADDLVISVDPDRIRQILLNFVSNAVKFTATGGVTLRTTYDPAAETLSVDVIDTGEGIPPEKQDRLFKRFSQVDGSLTRVQGGTGLGLAICKGLVEAMGGEIGMDSRMGEGSRFWFKIPAPWASHAKADDDRPLIERPTFAGVRVLVADDHPSNRELVRLFLAGVGAEVSEASDGEEAAQLASEWPFDVILMDLRMPRLDGLGALRRIRGSQGPNDATPILAFTADADTEIVGRLASMGFQDMVAKPLQPGALIAAVARATAFAGDVQSGNVSDGG